MTPLNEQGNLDTRSFELLLERFYDAECHGVYVCGQTGEGLSLPPAVRELAVEVAAANTPAGRSVIAHVGTASTADAVRLARHAVRAGAHAVSSRPPPSNCSFAGYYEALAAAASAPVLVLLPRILRCHPVFVRGAGIVCDPQCGGAQIHRLRLVPPLPDPALGPCRV